MSASTTYAGAQFSARYSAVVTNLSDPYGVFGASAIGDRIVGSIRYALPAPPPTYQDPTYASYDFAVAPGAGTRMTASLGSIEMRATQSVFVGLYNFEDPNSPPDSIYGYDFQFIDADTSVFTTSGLPAGYQLGDGGAYVGLFAMDPALIDFPNAPVSLLPLSAYDSYFTGAFAYVDIRDANGRYVDSAFIEFQLTRLTAVPEPSSAALAALALPVLCVWARRARTRLANRDRSTG
jgi:hypothetical protein